MLEQSRSGRRSLAGRPSETADRLVNAAVEALQEVGYDHLAMRDVCRRAGVTHATAYGYFASKPHLVSEAFHRRLQQWCAEPLVGAGATTRLERTFTGIATFLSDEPALSVAAMAAMLSDDPDVSRLRTSAGELIAERLAHALDDMYTPARLDALNIAVAGAMMHSGMGYISYETMAQRLIRASEFVLSGADNG